MCYTVVGNYSGGYRIAHKGRQPRANCANLLLPPANEVWGKVMFSEASVSHSVHGGGVCLRGRVYLQEGSASRGVCLRGPVSRGVFPPQMGYYGIQLTAGGAHPAGMHSCLTIFLQQNCMILKESGPRKFTAIVKVNNFYYDKNIKLYLNGKKAV